MIRNGRATVDVPGQRVPLGRAEAIMSEVYVRAPESNSGAVCVGDENVVAHADAYNSPELLPGEALPLLRNVDLGNVYMDARNAGDAVVWIGS